MAKRKYYKKLSEARKAAEEERKMNPLKDIGVYKMSKGTRHHGEYAVCSYMEWLNTN